VVGAWLWFLAAFTTRFVLRKLAGHDIRGLPPKRPRFGGATATPPTNRSETAA
jgi:hypothetical protein